MSAQRPTLAVEVQVEDLHRRSTDALHEKMYDAMDAAGVPEADMVKVVQRALGVHASEQFEEWAAS